MTDFSIFQLKEFTTFVGTLSYSETAHRLNISTSALTRHIQALESELGGLLFRRKGHKGTVLLCPFVV